MNSQRNFNKHYNGTSVDWIEVEIYLTNSDVSRGCMLCDLGRSSPSVASMRGSRGHTLTLISLPEVVSWYHPKEFHSTVSYDDIYLIQRSSIVLSESATNNFLLYFVNHEDFASQRFC